MYLLGGVGVGYLTSSVLWAQVFSCGVFYHEIMTHCKSWYCDLILCTKKEALCRELWFNGHRMSALLSFSSRERAKVCAWPVPSDEASPLCSVPFPPTWSGLVPVFNPTHWSFQETSGYHASPRQDMLLKFNLYIWQIKRQHRNSLFGSFSISYLYLCSWQYQQGLGTHLPGKTLSGFCTK